MPRAPRDLAEAVTVAAVLLVLTACPAIVRADHGKVDHVVFKSGDRLTCEIVRLIRGKMTVKTDARGTVAVEWNKVSRVDSRAEINSAVQREIINNLKWTFTLFESYNSAPPSGEKKNDFGVTAALGWTF